MMKYNTSIINSKKSITDFLLILLLLIVSGNPAFNAQSWAPLAFIIVGIVLLITLRKYININFINRYFLFISVFLVIFLIQFINLNYLSFPFVAGFLIKIFIGAIIFTKVRENFAPVFFEVIYWICLISFPFYIIHFFFGDNVLSDFWLVKSPGSIGFYTFRHQERIESLLRNSGMFWEPGAFQGYINLCFLMSFPLLPSLIKYKKRKLLVIFLAFITTQSTTGYVTFALLIGIYILLYININRVTSIMLFIVFGFIGLYFFNSLDFLGEKIRTQYDEGVARTNDGEFDPRRFGAFLFDLHYIQKNPLTGNGFNATTRFADHSELRSMIERGENPGHGNGFSNFIASAGILGIIWYLYSIYKYQKKYSVRDALILCLVIITITQGEDYFRFPFVIALAFFTPYLQKRNVKNNIRTTDLSQSPR